jgi:hypothetical protein
MQSPFSRRLIGWLLLGVGVFALVHVILYMVPHSVHLFR